MGAIAWSGMAGRTDDGFAMEMEGSQLRAGLTLLKVRPPDGGCIVYAALTFCEAISAADGIVSASRRRISKAS